MDYIGLSELFPQNNPLFSIMPLQHVVGSCCMFFCPTPHCSRLWRPRSPRQARCPAPRRDKPWQSHGGWWQGLGMPGARQGTHRQLDMLSQWLTMVNNGSQWLPPNYRGITGMSHITSFSLGSLGLSSLGAREPACKVNWISMISAKQFLTGNLLMRACPKRWQCLKGILIPTLNTS